MDNNIDLEKFVSEIEQYSIYDLELIYRTQKELYSKEELEIIKDILENKKTSLSQATADFDFGVTLFCIVGILTPISGLVAGVIMIIKGSPRWKDTGKKTLFAVFISVLLRIFLYSGGFRV